MPPHVLCGLRGPPSWVWQESNRFLRLGRPWGAVTLSRWCVSGDRGGCSARRALKPKFYLSTQTMVTAGILPFKENSRGRAGNRTRDLMVSSQRLWPLDHEAGPSVNAVEYTSAHPQTLRICVLCISVTLPQSLFLVECFPSPHSHLKYCRCPCLASNSVKVLDHLPVKTAKEFVAACSEREALQSAPVRPCRHKCHSNTRSLAGRPDIGHWHSNKRRHRTHRWQGAF